MKKNIFLLILFYIFHSGAIGQTFTNIGQYENTQVFVPQGSENLRVGNAVLINFVELDSVAGISTYETVLASCDGAWVTTPTHASFKFTKATVKEMYEFGKSAKKTLPLDKIEFLKPDDRNFQYSKMITKHAPALCKNAGMEPKNFTLPISEGLEKEETYLSYSLLLGTSSRQGSNLEVWMRISRYKYAPMTYSDGQTIIVDGRVQTQKEATGSYFMERSVINCKEKTMGIFHSVEYQKSGGEPKTLSIPKEKLQLDLVVPESIGDTLVSATCKLYGAK